MEFEIVKEELELRNATIEQLKEQIVQMSFEENKRQV